MSDLRGDQQASNQRLALKLGAVAVLALGFGFAMVPLYDVFCQVTGLNGDIERVANIPARAGVDRTRSVRVEFMGQAMPGLPVEFHPSQPSLNINPGDIVMARYWVKNPTNRMLVGNAVPSISPAEATKHFKKIDCFCFREQILAPGEEREMAVTFLIDPALSAAVTNISISYAFYNVAKKS